GHLHRRRGAVSRLDRYVEPRLHLRAVQLPEPEHRVRRHVHRTGDVHPRHAVMLRRLVLAAAALSFASSALASTKLDDSLSPRQRIDVVTHWLYDGVGDWNADQINALVADVHAMEFRLRTAAFVGRNAEIYLSVPLQVPGLRSPTAMRVEWTTRGVFSPGAVVPGNRALV